jgi:transposase
MSLFLGIDVAKASLDIASDTASIIASPNASAGGRSVERLANEPRAIGRLVRRLHTQSPPPRLIALEATGGYERRLLHALLDADLPVVRLNPLRVRRFAQSRGLLAKTDAIDARVIADFARLNADRLSPLRPTSDTARVLKELVTRRRQLVEQTVASKSQREHVTVPALRRSIDRTIKHLCAEIAEVERLIQEQIDNDPDLRARQAKLLAVKGIGPRVSRVIVSELPELGRIDKRKAAALVGVAPFNDDSGAHVGRRRIQGGRATVRAALYMATLVAARHDPVIRARYEHLKSRGKPKKVALVACMRTMVNYLTAVLADKETA